MQLEPERRLYKDIDFTKGIGNISDANFTAVIQNIAAKFWSRAPTAEEVGLFQTFRGEFTAELAMNERNSSNKTRALWLGICTAMLTSYESLSL